MNGIKATNLTVICNLGFIRIHLLTHLLKKHLLPQIPLQLLRKPLPVAIVLVRADNSLAIPHKLSPHMQRIAVEGVGRGVAQWPQRKLHVLGDAVYLHGGQEGNLYVLHMPRRPAPCWIAPHFGRLAARERFDSSRRNAHRNGHGARTRNVYQRV